MPLWLNESYETFKENKTKSYSNDTFVEEKIHVYDSIINRVYFKEMFNLYNKRFYYRLITLL